MTAPAINGSVLRPHAARLEQRTVRAELAIGRRAFGQLWKGAIVWGLVFGATVASSALTYVSTFPTQASRQLLDATTSSDAGLAVMLGPITSIDTVGGYTTYKNYVFLTTIGAVWALLAATRVLRGEEDRGRWQLMLAGSTRAGRATAATLVALAGAVGIVFIGTTLLTLITGRDPDVGFGTGEAAIYGLSLTIPIAVFAALGSLTSQLARTRRFATGLGMTVIGISFVVRMVADSGPGTQWLLWFTPFGWTELIRPLTENNLLPLVPAFTAVAVLSAGSIVLVGRRDVGEGLLASRDVSALRPFGLQSPTGLAARLESPVLLAWSLGLAASGVMFGIIAKLTTASLPPSMSDTLGKFGLEGAFADQYFGIFFLLVAAVVSLLPAGQVGAMADEEVSGRIAHVLARTTTRTTWYAGRLAIAAGGVLAAALMAGLGGWLGAWSQGVDVEAASMLYASLNVVPIALIALGIGAVVFAVVPRMAAMAVYTVVSWSLVVDLVASLVSGAGWLQRLSLFHYVALAPAQTPEPLTLAVTTGLAFALCAMGATLFGRRDLR